MKQYPVDNRSSLFSVCIHSAASHLLTCKHARRSPDFDESSPHESLLSIVRLHADVAIRSRCDLCTREDEQVRAAGECRVTA